MMISLEFPCIWDIPLHVAELIRRSSSSETDLVDLIRSYCASRIMSGESLKKSTRFVRSTQRSSRVE